jgi:hypothetical protein
MFDVGKLNIIKRFVQVGFPLAETIAGTEAI